MLKITIVCILIALARLGLAQLQCEDTDPDSPNVSVDLSASLSLGEGLFTLIAQVGWQVSNPQNDTLDGVAVKIEALINDGFSSVIGWETSQPCYSGASHVWVTSESNAGCNNHSLDCETNACLCLRNNCTVLPSSASCNGFFDSREDNFDFTISPELRNMTIPIQFDVGYRLTVMPYYRKRGVVRVARSTAVWNATGVCDEAVFRDVRDVYSGRACMDILISKPETGLVYEVTFQTAESGPVVDRINGPLNISNGAIQIEKCGLDHCQEYFITVYAVIGGITQEFIPTFIHTISSPFDDGTVIDFTQSTVATPIEGTTTAGTTTPDPTRPTWIPTNATKTSTSTVSVTANTNESSGPLLPTQPTWIPTNATQTSTSTVTVTASTNEPSTPSGLLCSSTRVIDNFTFPAVQPGLVSYSLGKCESDGTPLSSIECSQSSKIYDLSTLRISTCESIEQLISQNYSSTTLERLQIATANVTILTEENATSVTEYLGNISILGRRFSVKEVRETAEISSHLTEYFSQSNAGGSAAEKQNLVKSLSAIARRIDVNFTVTPIVSKLTNDINIEVTEVSPSQNLDYEFKATFYNTKDEDETFNPISIRVPAEALRRVEEEMATTSVRIVSVGFRSSSLFPSAKQTEWVISSELGDNVNAVDRIDLREASVTVTDNTIKNAGKNKLNDFKDEYRRLECVFWDFGIEEWSSEGCSLSSELPAICKCNHLTNFAILVSRFEIPSDVTLTVVSYVGCGLSIIGLLLTLLVICLSRKLRKRYQMQILGNICLCLVIGLLLFVFGVGSQVDTINCTVLTVFMHFFFLAAWFWTAVYSFMIYRDIVQVFPHGKSFKLRIAAVFAYGIPLVIVLLNSTIALAHVDDDHDDFLVDPLKQSSYRARNFCWLHSYSLYFGFLLAVGILLIFNIVVFSIAIPKLTCRKRKLSQIGRSTQQKSNVGKQVATVISLVTTMGFSWLFGFLMLISDNHAYLLTMSWLFTFVNGLQGILIFYFTAVRSGELRQLCAPINKRFTTITTSSTGVSSSEVRT